MSSQWEPLRDLMSLREAMNQLFEQSVVTPHSWGNGHRAAVRTLPIDLYATKDAYVLQANVPGIEPSSVNITIEGNTLSIRGEIKAPTQVDNYLLQERRFGAFERILNLDLPIQSDKVEATFQNGVLTLTLPKAEQAKPKIIKVKTA